MARLKESFRNEKVVAIWHQAPSKWVLQYGRDNVNETISVLVAETQPDAEVRTEWLGVRDFLSGVGV